MPLDQEHLGRVFGEKIPHQAAQIGQLLGLRGADRGGTTVKGDIARINRGSQRADLRNLAHLAQAEGATHARRLDRGQPCLEQGILIGRRNLRAAGARRGKLGHHDGHFARQIVNQHFDQLDALAAKGGFQPKYVEGYIFAFLSGTGYGVSPIFVRLALRDTDPGAALAGGLVSYLAASVVVAFLLLLPGQFAHARQVDRKATLWFVISGVTVMASQMFRYMALSIAPVSVVQPIQRLSLLLRFFFGWLINREHEVFSGKVWLSTIIALIGALLLTFTTEQVIAWVPMPEGMMTFLRMEWP